MEPMRSMERKKLMRYWENKILKKKFKPERQDRFPELGGE